MAQGLKYQEALGSSEAHLSLARKRVSDVEEAIRQAQENHKPEPYIQGLRNELEQAENQLVELEEQMGTLPKE